MPIANHRPRFGEWQTFFVTFDEVIQRLSADVLHHDEDMRSVAIEGMHPHDVRMRQLPRVRGFLSQHAQRLRMFAKHVAEHFDGDESICAVDLAVGCEENPAHPAFTEQLLENVSIA